jgi:hypothetical protein
MKYKPATLQCSTVLLAGILLVLSGCATAQEPKSTTNPPQQESLAKAELKPASDAQIVTFLTKLTANQKLWRAECDFKVFSTALKAVDGKNGATGVWFGSDGHTIGFPGEKPTDDFKEWLKPFGAWSDITVPAEGFKSPHPSPDVTVDYFTSEFGKPERERDETYAPVGKSAVKLKVFSYIGGRIEAGFSEGRLFWLTYGCSLSPHFLKLNAGQK